MRLFINTHQIKAGEKPKPTDKQLKPFIKDSYLYNLILWRVWLFHLEHIVVSFILINILHLYFIARFLLLHNFPKCSASMQKKDLNFWTAAKFLPLYEAVGEIKWLSTIALTALTTLPKQKFELAGHSLRWRGHLIL